MGEATKIQWTDHTFNPWIGCTKVHAGCEHCYAEADMDKRRHRVKWGPAGTRSKTAEANWREPIKWDREAAAAGERRRVFCASLADVFEDWQGPILGSKGEQYWTDGVGQFTPAEPPSSMRPLTLSDLRQNLFELIDQTPHLDWLLLTKRPQNVSRMWVCPKPGHYRPNVWLGTSVSDQPTYDKYAHLLYHTCRNLVPVLFLSVEPLLNSIKLWHSFDGQRVRNWAGVFEWVIVGGESGRDARPCTIGHIRELVEQCQAAEVPVFVKQLGSRPVNREGVPHPQHDSKGGDPEEWPEDLRVREFPRVVELRS